MTTRVTVLGTDAQTPGVWTGPQSMVQPSPLLGDDGGAGMLADATSQAIPNTLALRDADASFAVRALGLAAGAAFPAPDSSFAQIYYDQATRLFTFGTVAANFIVSGSAASEGASRLDIGGDSAVADELSIWASAADLDGPRISMGYSGSTLSLLADNLSLQNELGTNGLSISAPDGSPTATVQANSGKNLTLQSGLQLTFSSGPIGADPDELGNYAFIVGDLRSPGFTQASAIVAVAKTGGTTLFDWQYFGSGGPTGYLYWREAFPYGYRIQMTNASGTGQGYTVTATAAVGAVDNIVVGTNGSVTLAAVATQSLSIQSGSTNRIQVNGTGLGFFAAAPVAKPNVTGAKGGNVALANLLTALANLGLITDSTT